MRQYRHLLFSDEFQAELATIYKDSLRGQPPIPPAQLALATLLQAYTGVSDDELIEATLMDRRWQLVLDCLDTDVAPFSKGTLVASRAALIEHNLDLVMRLCRPILVMASGRLLVEGDPETVRSDPRVIDAYLGAPGSLPADQ